MAEIEIELPDLAPFQREWTAAPQRFVFIEGATGTGKTYVFEPELFREAHSPVNRGDEYWWIAPTLQQARAVFDNLLRLIEDADLLDVYQVSRAPMSITTPTGGVLRFLTADNPNFLYGIRNVRRIVGDEFTRWRISMWAALLTVANKTGARITFIGNYIGESSAWHLLIRNLDGDPEVRYFRTPATEAVSAGIMPADRFETARRTLAPSMFAALYLCEGTSDSSMLVDYAAVADCWTNDHVPEGQPALTCDIALQGSDLFVIGRWSGLRLMELETFSKREPQEVEAIIKGKATTYSVPRSRIVYDADGLGAYLRGYLQGAVPYNGSGVPIPQQGHKLSFQNLRAQCHYAAADAMRDRKLYFAPGVDRDLLTEEALHCLRHSGQDHAGRWGIVSKDHPTEGVRVRLGRSPDRFDVVPMRMVLELTPKAVIVDSLHSAAERKRITFAKPKPDRFTPWKGR